MKRYRYIWLPLALFIYGLAFLLYFGPEYHAAGKTSYLIIWATVDLGICTGLFFALRKKNQKG